MRTFVHKTITTLLRCYPYNLYLCLRSKLAAIYSIWISSALKSAGPGFRTASPVYLTGGKYITVGKNFSAQPHLRIEALDRFNSETFEPVITIGDNVNCNHYCHIISAGQVTIGNNVLLGSNVYISDRSHGDATWTSAGIRPIERPLTSKGPVIIEDNVWIGQNTVILSGVTIGRGCIIGANSVVSGNIPPGCVAAGSPARVIKSML